MVSAQQAWQRLEAWLSTHAPSIQKSLNPPATQQDFAALKAVVGQELPEELIAVYEVHNGQNEDDFGGLLPFGDNYGDMAHGLADIEKIIMDYEMMNELLDGGDFDGIEKEPNAAIKSAHWSKAWIPVANDGGGDFHCIDLDPGPEGVRGQVITVGEADVQTVVAKSLIDWLNQIAIDGEAGKLSFHEDYGLNRWSK